MWVDGKFERPSTIDGQTDVDRGSEENESSRQEQHHHTDSTSGTTVERWTDAAASTFTDHQPRDSTVDEQGGASTTDGQTNVDCGNVDSDTSRQVQLHHTNPTRRQRVACGGDDTAGCSAGHSHMSGDSRLVDSATHRCPRSPYDLAVISPSSRTATRQLHCSLPDLGSFVDSRIGVTSNLATLLSCAPWLN